MRHWYSWLFALGLLPAALWGWAGCSDVQVADPCAGIGDRCDDGKDCTQNVCTDVDGVAECRNPPEVDGTECTVDGNDGVCVDGLCSHDPCALNDCDDGNDCTVDGKCNPATGQCEGGSNADLDSACDHDGGSFCDGAGNCVECNRNSQCFDFACAITTCNVESHTCDAENVGGQCDYMGGPGVCHDAMCVDAGKCEPYPCRDDGPCVADACNPETGDCSYPNGPDDTACTTAAHEPGQCRSGACVPTEVASTVPADDATDVEVEITVSATTNVALDPASVSQSSLRLERDSEAIAGEVVLDASQTTVTFTPEDPLVVLTEHTATLSGVSSMSGVPLPQAHSWQFTVRDRRWGTPVPIEDREAGASNARVAMDPESNSVAVWLQSFGMDESVWSNRSTSLSEWGDVERIENTDAGYAMYPQIAMDAQGNAIAVWVQEDFASPGASISVFSNRYTPEEGWGAADWLYLAPGMVEAPRLVMNPAGDWLAVWSAHDLNAMPSFFIMTSGGSILNDWMVMDAIPIWPDVAIDAEGNVIVVWVEARPDDYINHLWFTRYTASTRGWSAAERLENSDESPGAPTVAMNIEGNAIVVWSQSGATYPGLWSKRFTSSAWQNAKPMYTGTGPSGAQVLLDAQGNALAVWRQSDGTASSIWASRSTLSGDWDTPELIENSDSVASALHVAMDSPGNAIAVWSQDDGPTPSIWANRFTPTGGWGTAHVIEEDDTAAYQPYVALDPAGNAAVVWQRYGDTRDIWSNQYR